MRREEDIIGTDFQGWPIYKMNLREIVEAICGPAVDGVYSIDSSNEILDIYPLVLEDDGMGYGVNEQRIIEFSVNSKDKYATVFVEQDIIKEEKNQSNDET